MGGPRDHKKISQESGAPAHFEARFQHRRVAQIAAFHFIAFGRLNGKLAALFAIEQCAEEQTPIKGRQTKPIDPAVGIDQRRRLAVPNQPVILDAIFFQSGVGLSLGKLECDAEIHSPLWHSKSKALKGTSDENQE